MVFGPDLSYIIVLFLILRFSNSWTKQLQIFLSLAYRWPLWDYSAADYVNQTNKSLVIIIHTPLVLFLWKTLSNTLVQQGLTGYELTGQDALMVRGGILSYSGETPILEAGMLHISGTSLRLGGMDLADMTPKVLLKALQCAQDSQTQLLGSFDAESAKIFCSN